MSAICGLFYKNYIRVDDDISRGMMSKLDKFTSDYSRIIKEDNFFLGCSFKAFTPESRIETLPFKDETSGLVITADAIIDNRSELFNLLNIPVNDRSNITDSRLILEAYRKWGEKSLNYLCGDFAFAIFDIKRNNLFCARDQVGKRTFYYFDCNEFFAFSTTIEPLFSITRIKKQLNKEWLAYFLALPGPVHEVNCEQTVYTNIMQLLPSHTIEISDQKIVLNQYWSPLNKEEIKYKTDSEYEEAFREVIYDSVNSCIRSFKPVSVMLSGGLDSGTVAVVAADILKKQGKVLNAYCAVPFTDYVNDLSSRLIADESQYVNEICKKAGNIKINYIKSDNKNSITDINEFLNIYEQPYKTIENSFWYNGIISTASKEGSDIILNGQFGNNTISYGSISSYLSTLLNKGKFFTLYKQMKEYSKFNNQRFLFILKCFLKDNLSENIFDIYHKLRGGKKDYNAPTILNKELSVKYKTIENLIRLGLLRSPKNVDINKEREFIFHPRFLSQIGMFETKIGLNYGMQIRDPTADKRVIEFCFRIPENQYVRNGNERFLLRRAMNGILPDKVRLNYMQRGYQSADWIQRLVPFWNDISEEIDEMLMNDMIKLFVDSELISSILAEIGSILDKKFTEKIRMIVVFLIFGRFLGNYCFKS